MAPTPFVRRDRSPQAATSPDPSRPIRTLRRSSTLSSFADETDTLYGSEAEEKGRDAAPYAPPHKQSSTFDRIWTAIVLTTSVYSTGLSGLWFIWAVTSYQFNVGGKHALSFSDLSTLIAAFAKSIELSFEFVSVAVLGQELTRRMTTRSCRGIDMAQMQAKAFLAQPGSMITNWTAVLHMTPTLLGVTCWFIAAIGILYTTASDALVAPSLTLTSLGTQNVPAVVNTAFLNISAMERNCPAQVNTSQDPNALSTCNAIDDSGTVYRDLISYLNSFDGTVANKKTNMSVASNRPKPMAQFNDNVNVHGEWLRDPRNQDAPIVYQRNGRTINNVTMLVPHAGVVGPSGHWARKMSSQSGAGQMQVTATVTTPTVNVQCASFDEHDPSLTALVIPEWSAAQNASMKPNMTAIFNATDSSVKAGWYNGTSFDPLWQFSPSHRPPVFPNLPGPYNTRISWAKTTNGTAYLLGRAPNQDLFMCAMTATLSHNCSTKYSSSSTGGQLELDCSASNPLAYMSHQRPAPAIIGFVPSVNAWSLSLGLGAAMDADTSLARMLTQLWPTSGVWNPNKPTMAEALAVLSSSLLLKGAVFAPFGDTDQEGMLLGAKPTNVATAAATLTASIFEPEATTSATATATATQSGLGRRGAPAVTSGPTMLAGFQADVQMSVYSAGSNSPGQLGFFVVLMGAWFLNILFLLYTVGTIVARRRSTGAELGADAEGAGTWTLRADLADPQALFGLAMNSRPDERLADPILKPLPRKAMAQRWRVVGSKYSVYIHPIGPRRSPLRRAMSSALSSTVGTITRKNSAFRKETIIHEGPVR